MEEKILQDRYNLAIKKLREMRRNKIFTDVLLQCKGGFIHAHRCVLMATNTFFYKMFTTHLVGDNVIQIEFENVNVEVMDIIISCIYGEIPRTFKKDIEQLIKVLETCHMIEETIMFNYCIKVAMDLLCIENCIVLWNIMSKYEENEFEKQIMQFVLRNLTQLLKHGKLMHISSCLMAKFVNFASESTDLGDDLLPLVIEWCKKKPGERLDKLLQMFALLRNLTFSKECTSNYMKFDWFVKSSPELLSCLNSLTIRTVNAKNPFLIEGCNDTTTESPSNNSILPSNNSQVVSKNATLTLSPTITSSRTDSTDIEYLKMKMKPQKQLVEVFNYKNSNERMPLFFHFYSKADMHSLEMITQKFDITDKKWYKIVEVKLPGSLSSNWYPMTSIYGDEFYFAISNDKYFVAYNQKVNITHQGPAVSFQSRVTGIVDGKFMYVWNYESIVQFNADTTEWKVLAPIRNVLAASNLLGVNGSLYFHAAFPPSIMKYDFLKNEWVTVKCFKESSAIKSIKCKCLQVNCKKKLYFVANDKQLLSYDTETNVWAGKTIPDLKCSLPLFMNCDESLILFGDRHNKFNYFIYYPVENKWSSFRNKNISWQDVRCVACDVSLITS